VGIPWFLLLALFWAVLWRPRARAGMAAAAATAFFASSALPLTLLLAPLVAARLIVLRRPRDHAVTIGWAAGLLLQLPGILEAAATHQSRLSRRVPVGDALSFYVHGVVQFALGWHIGWWLRSAAGRDGTAAVAGAVLGAFFAWALVAGPLQTRLLIVAALLTGFVFTVVAADIGYGFAQIGNGVTVHHDPGSRYTALGIFLLDCAAIAAVDALIQRRRDNSSENSSENSSSSHGNDLAGFSTRGQARPVVPVLVLLAVLSAGWATDYRFGTPRELGPARSWSTVLSGWEQHCAGKLAGSVRVAAWDVPPHATESIPCARIRP
jgi:hypothetical protein